MAIKEIDLPEATRRNDTFNDLMEISNHLSEMSVFPSLVWVWAFDIIKDIFDNNQITDLAANDYVDEAVPAGTPSSEISVSARSAI